MEWSVRARVGTVLDFVYIKALVVNIIIQKAKFAGKKYKTYQDLYNEVFYFHLHTFHSGIFKIEDTTRQCSTYGTGITQSPGSSCKGNHSAFLLLG